MNSKTKHEIIAVLKQQGRGDLAQQITGELDPKGARYAVDFLDGIAANMHATKQALAKGDRDKACKILGAAIGNLVTVVSNLADPITSVPKSLQYLRKARDLVEQGN